MECGAPALGTPERELHRQRRLARRTQRRRRRTRNQENCQGRKQQAQHAVPRRWRWVSVKCNDYNNVCKFFCGCRYRWAEAAERAAAARLHSNASLPRENKRKEPLGQANSTSPTLGLDDRFVFNYWLHKCTDSKQSFYISIYLTLKHVVKQVPFTFILFHWFVKMIQLCDLSNDIRCVLRFSFV